MYILPNVKKSSLEAVDIVVKKLKVLISVKKKINRNSGLQNDYIPKTMSFCVRQITCSRPDS